MSNVTAQHTTAHALVLRTTRAQGLTPAVTDPSVLARLAGLLTAEHHPQAGA